MTSSFHLRVLTFSREVGSASSSSTFSVACVLWQLCLPRWEVNLMWFWTECHPTTFLMFCCTRLPWLKISKKGGWQCVGMTGFYDLGHSRFIPFCYLILLHKLQKWICRTVGPSVATSLEPFTHHWNVASLSLSYMYYFDRFSYVLA